MVELYCSRAPQFLLSQIVHVHPQIVRVVIQPVWPNDRAYNSGPRGPGFVTRVSQLVFLLGKEIT